MVKDVSDSDQGGESRAWEFVLLLLPLNSQEDSNGHPVSFKVS